ncbi:hypothetical protein UFOVP1636_255 [uncultured Caudovirales phage]|uniref:Uncharacterized protein n=1 Tax=uncultured Caudovirales phage TaxID=2100421 RepID=A0A6J5T448_9CAUD|nr:hypothetical protein UFOVP1636_255 [uncultured Caudovirales phage]
MLTYKHSGTTGDLIYSLYLVRKMGGGHFKVAIENIENCVSKYGYQSADMDPAHRGRFTTQDFEWLKPLLERQPYINEISMWRQGDNEPDTDLDRFRGVLYRSFEGNILEAYFRTFNIPFTKSDYDNPWLTADVIRAAPVVITRSARYLPPHGEQAWKNLIKEIDLAATAIFVGTKSEHATFVETFKVPVPYRPVNNFLELASIINGADLFLGNQGFAYSLATGLGKSSLLEINTVVPRHRNECYFPRPNAQYF